MSLVGQFLILLNIPLLLMGEVTISWVAILLLMLAPGLSGVLQLALSRTREYAADLGAVQLTGDPRGLASALRRLEQLNRGLLSRLFPGAGRVPLPQFLQTHPETDERVRRLLRLQREPWAQREDGRWAFVPVHREWERWSSLHPVGPHGVSFQPPKAHFNH
jgi:heat shock protein HtpX